MPNHPFKLELRQHIPHGPNLSETQQEWSDIMHDIDRLTGREQELKLREIYAKQQVAMTMLRNGTRCGPFPSPFCCNKCYNCMVCNECCADGITLVVRDLKYSL